MVELTQLLSVDWLTPLHTISEAESKLLQYRCAADLGIGTPRTVVASERDLIPTEFGDPVIVKPLGPAQFTDERGEPRVVFTTELARAAPELDELGGAPFLVQERVRATRHLRIVTVRQESWVCALEAADLPVDWRIVEEAHHAFAPSEAFADTAASAVELASAMGVGYSSQDWIVTDEGAFFVDLNPAGQWLFLPDPVASEVTGAIASWLVAE